MFRKLAIGALIAAIPSLASAHMVVENGFARSSNPQAGAAFMTIFNHSDMDDRVVAVTSDAAQRTELHTHIQDADGVMRMVEVEDGFTIAAGETIELRRGGMHVMFMGLNETWKNGEEVTFTLEFEHADPVTVIFAVDNDRMPTGGHGGHGDHADHSDHGEEDHSGHDH